MRGNCVLSIHDAISFVNLKISYPAGHLLIHRFLHLVTDGGANMALAQQIYGGLYLVSQFLTIAVYAAAGDVPNYLLLALPLSKRLHSIYVLRMFNDCWAIPLLLTSILMLRRRKLGAASVLFRCVFVYSAISNYDGWRYLRLVPHFR